MSEKRCVIIGASPESGLSSVKELIRADDTIVCADGGYMKAAQYGIVPFAIIGDFDSAPEPDNAGCEIIRLPVKKDDTDTMFCIREFAKRGFRDFLLLGMTGGRPDHTAANHAALLYLARRGMKGCIADGGCRYHVLSEDSLVIEDSRELGFGIFAFGCEKCTITLEGFLYEVSRFTLRADEPIGSSNTVLSDKARVCVHDGSALIVIYRK